MSSTQVSSTRGEGRSARQLRSKPQREELKRRMEALGRKHDRTHDHAHTPKTTTWGHLRLIRGDANRVCLLPAQATGLQVIGKMACS
jgi:hypothetical protein